MSNALSIYVNNALITETVDFVRVTQAGGEHEMALVDIIVKPGARLWSTWTPISIVWSDGLGRQTFYGYVHHVDYLSQAVATVQRARAVCVGTTMPLKTEQSRSWTRCTESYVAAEVVREYSLRLVSDPTGLVVPGIAQSGQSDWAFLCSLAIQAGYICHAQGSTVFFVNPQRVLQNPLWSTPTFSMGSTFGKGYSMLTFAPREDEIGTPNAPSSVTRRIVGIDAATGKLIGARTMSGTGGSAISHTAQGQATSRQSDVERVVNAAARTTINWVRAVATLVGGATVQPSATVDVTGTGISADHAGMWLVGGATHTLAWNATGRQWDYTVTAELMRDRVYATSYTVSQDWASAATYAGTHLVNGRWVAADSGRVR